MRRRQRGKLRALLLLTTTVAASASPTGAAAAEHDYELPVEDWKDTITPGTLASPEGIELEAELATNPEPELAALLEDFVFDYNEDCWALYGDLSHGIWLDDEMRRRADPRDLPTQEALNLEDGPLGTPFSPRDEGGELWTARNEEVLPPFDPEASLLPTEPARADVGDEQTPMTAGSVDLRYMDEGAAYDLAAALSGALSVSENPGLIETEAGPMLPAPGADLDLVADEFLGRGGDALCMHPTEEQCLDLAWHESWCGRESFRKHGDDPGWVCADVLGAAEAQYLAEASPNIGPVLEPQTLVANGQAVTRIGNVRADGVTVPLHPDAAYRESSRTDLVGALSAADVAARAAKVAGWESNGGIYSCEEFAFEHSLDASRLDEASKAHQRNPQWIFDAILYGRDGVGPFLNPGKDRPETLFRTDGPGSIEYLRSADGPYGDSGFVPWS
ncbi:MAG: hypothetical protein AAGA54_30350, partial [Myxococcota bacterium]